MSAATSELPGSPHTSLIEVLGRYLDLKPKGAGTFSAYCPFCEAAEPKLIAHLGTGRWHCFNCGEDGDWAHFISLIEDVPEAEAEAFIATHLQTRQTTGAALAEVQVPVLPEAAAATEAETVRAAAAPVTHEPASDTPATVESIPEPVSSEPVSVPTSRVFANIDTSSIQAGLAALKGYQGSSAFLDTKLLFNELGNMLPNLDIANARLDAIAALARKILGGPSDLDDHDILFHASDEGYWMRSVRLQADGVLRVHLRLSGEANLPLARLRLNKLLPQPAYQ